MSEQFTNLETIEAEIESPSDFTITAKSFKRWRGKMRILSAIHAEIDPVLYERQKARRQLFHGADDRQGPSPEELAAIEAAETA